MDSEDELDSPLIQGWFAVDHIHYQAVLTKDSLNWTTDVKANAKKLYSHSLPYEIILWVRALHDTKSDDIVGFDVFYIKRGKVKLKREHVQFFGASKACVEWMALIQRQILAVEDRPRKLLVLVNPVSGQSIINQSIGVKIFETQAKPIFEEAGVKIVSELVTEEARQAEAILQDFDLDLIDSIVLIGGDGLYHEVVNGLIKRRLMEAELDVNDVNAKVDVCDMPIGIIPAGTGNGVAESCYGVDDVDTAIYGIILGKTSTMNVLGVYEDNRLLSFASLMVGYGFWADVASYTDSKRFLGILRYAVALLDFGFFRTQRTTELTIEYLKRIEGEEPPKMANGHARPRGKHHPKSENGAKGQEPAKEKRFVWQTQHGSYVAMVCFALDILSYLDPRRTKDLSVTTTVFNKPCSRWNTLKFLFGLVNRNIDVLKLDNVEHEAVKGVKVTLNNPAPPDTEKGRKERVLNLDGEIFNLKELSFEIRHHPEVMTLFSTT